MGRLTMKMMLDPANRYGARECWSVDQPAALISGRESIGACLFPAPSTAPEDEAKPQRRPSHSLLRKNGHLPA